MTHTEFEAVVDAREDGPVIALKGNVDRSALRRMDEVYQEASTYVGEILLDFSEVHYINSTGIAVIVGVLGKARAEGRRLGASGLTDHYREVFEITRLSDLIEIHEDEARR